MSTILQDACIALLQHLQENGAPAYERGFDYATRGCVHLGELDAQRVTAQVSGTDDYAVVLTASESGDLDTDCSCPVGQRAECCKHVAAVAIAVTHASTQSPAKPRATRPAPPDPLPGIIEELDAPAMRKLLREACEHDRNLRDRILLVGASRDGTEAMASQWKAAMRSACSSRGFVDWRRMGELARRIDQQLAVLDDWLDAGHGALVVALAEYAADRVEGMIGKVDDSDGSISYLLTRISEQHQRACSQARPEPRELAKRLFRREVAGAWDTFRDAMLMYADVLGEEGIAVYRQLAERLWAKVPPLEPGQMEGRHEDGRFTITRIMENLARRDNDVDALVRVYARDLSLPYGYLQIAEALLEAGRATEALQWAETGHKAFPEGHGDDRLTSFIVERYLADGLIEDALRLAKLMFDRHPVPSRWALLKSVAERDGSWTTLRATLLANIRARIDAENPRFRSLRDHDGQGANRSAVVELLLADDDDEAAWQEARLGWCHEGVWLALAERRARGHPADSIAIYQRLASDTLRQTGKSHYKRAVGLIAQAVRLLESSQNAAAAGQYLHSLRVTYQRRPAFLAMLDRLG